VSGTVDVVVIGAGQGGLSAAYFLRRWDMDFVLLDHGDRPGGAWRDRWPSLKLGTANRIHDLPGLAFGEQDLEAPAAEVVPAYFARYETEFDLPVRRPVHVRAVTDGGERLSVHTGEGEWAGRAVINATGTWERPFWPHYPGRETFRGRQLHTADYRGPEPFRGARVIVVGGGISAVQLLTEIAEVARTTWVTRRPPEFTDAVFTPQRGRMAVARAQQAVAAGRPPESVVSVTGLPLTPELARAMETGVLHRRPMFTRINPDGVVFPDGSTLAADVILWATGFRPALSHLAPLRLRNACGGIRMDGTQVAAEPRLHLIGYGPSASTVGANRAGRFAVRDIRGLLGQRSYRDPARA
jgi:cation diffusion facilitator CzcD-associated flavoprotein CzcO